MVLKMSTGSFAGEIPSVFVMGIFTGNKVITVVVMEIFYGVLKLKSDQHYLTFFYKHYLIIYYSVGTIMWYTDEETEL